MGLLRYVLKIQKKGPVAGQQTRQQQRRADFKDSWGLMLNTHL
jgi:hypothetical protein